MQRQELTQITESNQTMDTSSVDQQILDPEHPCDECEDELAELYCDGCEQKLCSACDTKIHNKGKRAQHKRKRLSSKLDFLQIHSLIFISHSYLELKPAADGDKAIKTIYDYIYSQLQPLKLDPKQTFLYVCHEGTLSSDTESELKRYFAKITTNVALENLFTLEGLEEPQNINNDYEALNFSKDDQIINWAKATSFLAQGIFVDRIFLFYPNYSLKVGLILQSTGKLNENVKLFILENADTSGMNTPITTSGNSAIQGSQLTMLSTFHKHKLVELTPKRFMKFINESRYKEKQTSNNEEGKAINDEGKSENFKPISQTNNMSELASKNQVGSEILQQLMGDETQNEGSRHNPSQSSDSFNHQSTPNPMLNQSFEYPRHQNLKYGYNNLSDNQSFDESIIGLPLNTSVGDYLNNSSDQFAPHSLQAKSLNKTYHYSPLPEESNSRGHANPTGAVQNSGSHGPSQFSRTSGSIFAYIRQPWKDNEIDRSLKISHYVQQELRKLAVEGDLMVPKQSFEKMISEDLRKKFNRNAPDVLKKAEEVEVIHTTIRKFMNAEPLYFVGLHLDTLTIESLGWIVKSIKKDGMTPTEKLILSRIKECFALKVDLKIWKSLINFLLLNEGTKKANWSDNHSVLPLKISKVIDPLLGTESYIIYIKNDEWVPDDQGSVNEESSIWKDFLSFIDNFFKEEEESQEDLTANSNPLGANTDESQKKQNAGWSSSVENVLSRSNNKKEKNAKAAKDMKAIPGGRYGCAQFIKSCGPDSLKSASLGKLNLLVQEAINKGILRYQRTLLVKNNQTENFSFDGKNQLSDANISAEPMNMSGIQDNSSFAHEAHEKKANQLNQIKRALYELLIENPGGLSLAQIPQFLKNKITFSFNLQDFGFPKLKNLLATMSEDVKIELSGTNHSYAVLKNPQTFAKKYKELTQKEENVLKSPMLTKEEEAGAIFDPNRKLNMYHSQSLGNNPQGSKSYQPLNNYQPENKGMNPFVHANSDGNFKSPEMNFNSQILNQPPGKPMTATKGKKMSNLDEYLGSVRSIIQMVIAENPYGINIDKLYQLLSIRLGFEFNYRLFGCPNFYEFLINSADNLIDIEVKKNGMQKISYVIYPKNFRFGPPGIIYRVPENQETQTTPIKGTMQSNTGMPTNSQTDSKKLTANPNLNLKAAPFVFNNDGGNPSADKIDYESYSVGKNPSHRATQSIGSTYMASFGQNQLSGPIVPTKNPNAGGVGGFYEGEERNQISSPFEIEESPKHTRSVSYWNYSPDSNLPSNLHSNYFGGLGGKNVYTYPGAVMSNISNISNIHTATHSRNESKNLRIPEESNSDLNENLKFIEELLRENEDDKILLSFSDRGDPSFISPNLSFTTIPHAQFVQTKLHSKTLSSGFPNQQVEQISSMKSHGRVHSVFGPAESKMKNSLNQS